MVELGLGILAAIGASSLYSVGIALQATDAKQAPQAEHLRLALIRGLMQRKRWLLGTGLSILGFPLQVVALLLAPLVVVQPALAAGLLVLLVLGERMLNEHAGRSEHLATVAIVLGMLGVALCAPPRSASEAGEHLTITLVLLGLGLASLAPFLLRALGRANHNVTVLGAGIAFGWSGIATKLASNDFEVHHLGLAMAWVASTAVASIVAVVSEMSALQSRPAIQVAPVVFVTQTVIPVAFAPVLFHESFSATPLGGVPLGVSLAVLIAGAALLARSPLLVALMEGERMSPASGSTRSPEEPSHVTMRSSPATEPAEPPSSTTSTSPARIGR